MHPELQPYVRGSRTRVLALDLAKTYTGYAIVEVPAVAQHGDTLLWRDWGRFLSDPRNDKFMFLLGQQLQKALIAEIKAHQQAGFNVHVVIEHPLFARSRSEQQYFLFQSALNACQQCNVNVSTPTVMYLKSFIKHQVEDIAAYQQAANKHFGKKPKRQRGRYAPPIEKHHIAYIYEQVTYPTNPDFPPPEQIKNDDEYDAIYLAWLGAMFTTHIPEFVPRYFQEPITAVPDTVWYRHSCFGTGLRLTEARRYVNSSYPSVTGLKTVTANWRKNNHGSWECNVEYLFNQITTLQYYYNLWHKQDAATAEAWLKGVQAKRTQRDSEVPTNLVPNYAGKFFCHTDLRRLSAAHP